MKSQNSTPLFDALKELRERNMTHFDVPGHKRGKGIPEFKEYFGDVMLESDVNSMKCLDNLSNPTSVIKEAEQLLAEAFGADYSFFLINGTSSGVQAMIMSVCKPGDKIILPRNAHKSAINGLILSGAVPVYIKPEISVEHGMAMGITMESVESAIVNNPDSKAIFIINPTYYGVTSDLRDIVKLAHKHGIAVLVDEAHGTHFAFHDSLPDSGMKHGADMSAVSLHKTGGSLTQSSALLLNEGLIDRNTVKTILNLTQTTSASYLLMSSLDVARKNLAINGERILGEIIDLCEEARNEINEIPGMFCFGKELIGSPGVIDYDVTKLAVNVSGIGLTGFEVYDILRDEYNLQAELGDVYNVLAIVSLGDSRESLLNLVEALRSISEKYTREPIRIESFKNLEQSIIISPRNAFFSGKRIVDLDESVGEISGESIMAYPPGIPIVTPGEKITEEIVRYIKLLKSNMTLITDSEDPDVNTIKVLSL